MITSFRRRGPIRFGQNNFFLWRMFIVRSTCSKVGKCCGRGVVWYQTNRISIKLRTKSCGGSTSQVFLNSTEEMVCWWTRGSKPWLSDHGSRRSLRHYHRYWMVRWCQHWYWRQTWWSRCDWWDSWKWTTNVQLLVCGLGGGVKGNKTILVWHGF